MMTLDRNDPEIREVIDRAAVAAEWLLDHHNEQYDQEFALDVLNDYVGGLLGHLHGGRRGDQMRDPYRRLAWALSLTEKRTDLRQHEQKLLELAWQRVKDDAVQREWERLGGAV